MTTVRINSALFSALERAANLPDVDLDYGEYLDRLSNSDFGDLTALQLSSQLIRLHQTIWEDNFPFGFTEVDYEYRFTGAGLKPVNSLAALEAAINDGLASGTLNRFDMIREGTTILSLSMGAAGYVLATGAQSITFSGHLPYTFTQFYQLADLGNQLLHADDLTDAQRNALFAKFGAYGLSGLTITDHGETLMSAQTSATTASLMINGLTLTLSGTFPTDFGQVLGTLWDVYVQTSDTGSIDWNDLSHLALTSLRVTDAAGHVLLTASPLTDGSDVLTLVNGVVANNVLIGDMGGDLLADEPGASRAVLAGLGGDDQLYGGSAADRLYGGTGWDDLHGSFGNDRLYGGFGRDTLTGGGNNDVFVFLNNEGTDRIADFAVGQDKIELRAANSLADLSFVTVGANVHVVFHGNRIIVEHMTVAQLQDADNFLF